MKRLVLLRHGKADPGGRANDRARALTERGREDAGRVADYMRRKQYLPDQVLCSPSARTRETLEFWSARIAEHPQALFPDALYLAEPETILSLIRRTLPAVQTMMVVGHNPGLEELAAQLSRDPAKAREKDRFDALEEKFPTGALAVLDFDASDWGAVAPGLGVLVDFVRPKDLKG